MLTLSAAEIVGQHLKLKKGVVVVLESTIYPRVTEEVVAPILDLENESGLKCGADFKIGYSPERINPGDEAHALDRITKIVAGMDEETTEILAELYGLITSVYKAKDIRTAEAAKVIDKPFLKTFLKSFIKKASQKRAFSERTVIFSFSTNLFFQTLGKFDQQTFRKSFTKNASQLRRKKSFTNNFFTSGKNLD